MHSREAAAVIPSTRCATATGQTDGLPYIRCRSCGVLSYTPRSALHGACPECGLPLERLAGTAVVGSQPDGRLDALVDLTRELLGADVAILTEIRDGRETAQRVSGDWPSRALMRGASVALEDTFCQRLLEGRIGNYVRDAAADERVRDLAMARELGVRAWLGVPIQPSNTELYMLCCLAREVRPDLGDREVRLLRGLAESVLAELQSS
jgi:GAF domain-containing protein